MAVAIRHALAGVDPNIIVDAVTPLDTELGGFTAGDRVRTGLVGAFALTALLLAAIGLYGVLSSDVTQRRQEIGVRLALGAEPRAVRWMILRRGLVTSLIGVTIGTVAALGLGRLVASLLYGVTPADSVAFAGAGLLLLIVAAIVSYLPARRASRLDPMHALRQQ
jgi:putative ABC transport system permease protein